ncbi:MAG: hypothetical protein M1587_01535, partial [Thaumarchaeota archaeon]|nr:hypothetical protein [Nitrososphaerota archaeon]
MNKTYLIELQPLSTFYFGSERNFEGGQSYFARSLQFPQQTTLLGALRFKLLQSRDLLDSSGQIVDYSRAESLIGPNSFTADKCAEPKDYGVIKGLSHLFLMRGDEIFCAGNLDYHCTFVRDEEGRSFIDGARRFIPALKGYDPKNPDRPRMVSSKGNSVLNDDIFLEVEQVGNRKAKPRFLTTASRSPDDDEKGFYKQIFYRFAKPSMPGEFPWRFAFLAMMEEADGDQLARYTSGQQHVTPIGGERSPFNFEVCECPAELLAQFSTRIYYSTSQSSE